MKDYSKHWFWGPIIKSRGVYYQVALGSVFINLFALVTAFYIMTVYDKILPNYAVDSLIALAIGVIVVFFFDFAMKMLRTYYIDLAGLSVDQSVGDRIFNKMTSQDQYNDKDMHQNAGSMASVVKEFDNLKELFTSASLNTFIDLPFMLFFIGVIFSIGGPVGYVPLGIVVVVILFSLFFHPLIKRFTVSNYNSNSNKYGVLIEMLNNIDTVKAIAGGKKLKSDWNKSVRDHSKSGLRARLITSTVANIASTGMQFSSLGIVFMGVFLVADNRLSTGALIASVILSGRTLAPLGQFSNTLGKINQALKAYSAIDSLMDTMTIEESKSEQIEVNKLEGSVKLENISFTYPGQNSPVFDNLNLEIKPGERVAIMGTVGCGKTTLISLMLGLRKPDNGHVLVDKMNVNSIRQDDLRSHIGVVLQNVQLFSGTIEDNIKINSENISNDQFFAASKITGVDAFAGQLPDAYHFQLKENGMGLSGGQKQAIAWARGIINEPNILILDEPTSSMDAQTEKQLLNNMDEYFEGRTIIMCTHRTSFLEKATRVIVLDNGKIALDKSKDEYMRMVQSNLEAV